MPPALQVEGLSKSFRLYTRRTQSLVERFLLQRPSQYTMLPALQGVSFEVPPGTLLGLVGRNGSGKSTLLKVLANIYRADAGRFVASGRMAGLLELGAGFHPELTGRENIYLNGSILGIPSGVIRKKFDTIVDFSGLAPFLETPIKAYSSGMVVRLGFSVAMAAEPDILLVDEVLGVGDAAFALKSVETIRRFVASGKTVVFVSHDLPLVTELADRVLWLESGELRGEGEPAMVVQEYLALLRRQGSLPVSEAAAAAFGLGAEEPVVKVTSLLMRNQDGLETALFNTGDPAQLYMALEAREPVGQAYVQLAVKGPLGEPVLGPLTVSLPPFHEGRAGGAFRFHRLPLNKGEYTVSLEVWDANLLKRYTARPALLRFTIGRSANPDVEGPWEIPGEWEWS